MFGFSKKEIFMNMDAYVDKKDAEEAAYIVKKALERR